MRSHRVIAVLFAGIVAAACGGDDGGTNPPDNQAPVAAFTAPSCTVGVACQFTDASTDPDGADDITGWAWAFGDDAESTEQSPAHTYEAAGTVTVTLTVTDAAGATSAPVSHEVTVAAAGTGPTADFSVSCAGLVCTFTDASTPAGDLTWAWDFGEPTSGADNTSTEQNPQHTYTVTEVTEFTATLTVTDGDGNVSAPHTETFTVSPPAGCVSGTADIDCTLDISAKSTLVITLTSTDCQDGNQLEITAPISEVVFTDGCVVTPLPKDYVINGGTAFDAGTQLTFKFTQGAGDPDDPPRVAPQIQLDGTYPDWTLKIDDGGNSTVQGEPDFNDLELTVHATAAP